jgi:hypothetical protein
MHLIVEFVELFLGRFRTKLRQDLWECGSVSVSGCGCGCGCVGVGVNVCGSVEGLHYCPVALSGNGLRVY